MPRNSKARPAPRAIHNLPSDVSNVSNRQACIHTIPTNIINVQLLTTNLCDGNSLANQHVRFRLKRATEKFCSGNAVNASPVTKFLNFYRPFNAASRAPAAETRNSSRQSCQQAKRPPRSTIWNNYFKMWKSVHQNRLNSQIYRQNHQGLITRSCSLFSGR